MRSKLMAFIAMSVATSVPAQLLTDPNDPRNWQGATVGTFAQLLYGSNTLANRQLLIQNQVLDEGIFDPTSYVAGTLLPTAWTTAGGGGCLGVSSDTTGSGSLGYSCSGASVFAHANAIDNLWFQSGGTVGQTVFDLGGPVQKCAIFNSIDHGPLPQEAIESTAYFSNDLIVWTQAVVERVWLNGFHANLGVLWDGFVYAAGTGTGSTFRYVSIIHGGPGALINDGDDEINGVMGIVGSFAPAFIDVSVVPADVAVAPSAPSVAQTAVVSAVLRNLGNTTSNARASLYEGDPDFGGTLIGTQTQLIAYGSSQTYSFLWTPTTAGLRPLFVVAENLTSNYADADPGNNRATVVVAVDAAPEVLAVNGGEVVAWPGATFTTAVSVQNVGAAPATLTSVTAAGTWATVIGTPSAAPLQPGQSVQVLVEIAVPPGTAGGPAGGVPIPYPILVSAATPSATFVDELFVRVFAQPVSLTTVQVVNASGGAPIGGANVAVEGLSGGFVADGSGQVVVALPDGARGFFAYAPGFIATQTTAVVAGPTTVVVALEAGQSLAVQQITEQPLSTAEILARGVNPAALANNVVVDFVVALQISAPPLVVPTVILPIAPPVGTVLTFNGTCVNAAGTGFAVTSTFTWTASGRTETWIIIPGSVAALKQFFDVTMVVVNRAVASPPQNVQFVNTTATIGLPAGLVLPDLFGAPQSATKSVGVLNAGDTAQVSWVVRGDAPGSYVVTGSTTGDLHAFGSYVTTLTAGGQTQPFSVVMPQLRLSFQTPTSVVAGQPFAFGVLVTNEQVVTAQFVRVAIDVQGLVNCRPCPIPTPPGFPPFAPGSPVVILDGSGNVARIELTLGDIEPGTSATASFCLESLVTGIVTNVQSVVWTSTETAPSVTLAPYYPGTGGDCLMLSGIVGDVGSAPAKTLAPGSTFRVHLASPLGTAVGTPITLGLELFYPGDPATPPGGGVFGQWLDFNALFVLDGFSANPANLQTVAPGGNTFDFVVPGGFSGSRLMLQAVFWGYGVGGTFVYCTTDGHELTLL